MSIRSVIPASAPCRETRTRSLHPDERQAPRTSHHRCLGLTERRRAEGLRRSQLPAACWLIAPAAASNPGTMVSSKKATAPARSRASRASRSSSDSSCLAIAPGDRCSASLMSTPVSMKQSRHQDSSALSWQRVPPLPGAQQLRPHSMPQSPSKSVLIGPLVTNAKRT